MKSFITAIFILITSFSWSNGDPEPLKCQIQGTVMESGTNETLPGVRVSIAGTDIFTFSDKDGQFSFEGAPAGDLLISFQLVSFEFGQVQFQSNTISENTIVFELMPR